MTDAVVPREPLPPAGWYPAVDKPGYERWWDGVQWTAADRPMMQAGTPAQHQFAVAPAGVATAAHLPLSDQRISGAEVGLAWIFTVLTLGYMLPWAIAATRGKSNSVAVAVINFLLGWTLVGWVIALIMACTAHQQRVNMVQMVNVPHYYQPPTDR
jgi:hypothetical protein